MATTTIPDYPRGITFEEVWAALKETAERQKETDRIIKETAERQKETAERQKETDRELRENARKQQEESAREYRELRESMKETDRKFKETDRKIGELGNRFGELAEHLVAPSICEKFNELHFSFENTSQNHVIRNAEGRCIAEIDLLLENGDIVIAVEVKAKPNQKDVDDHIGRMEILRRRADARHDTRKFQGAIAGAIMSEAVRNYAHKTGFYVIEQTGDTVKIAIPEGFTPGEW